MQDDNLNNQKKRKHNFFTFHRGSFSVVNIINHLRIYSVTIVNYFFKNLSPYLEQIKIKSLNLQCRIKVDKKGIFNNLHHGKERRKRESYFTL